MSDGAVDGADRATCRGKLLLVEDEPQVRSTYARLLRNAGFSIEAVGDGDSALGLIDARDFDAVLSDIMLPGISGVDLVRLVHERDADLPVVLMTAAGTLSSAVGALEHGAIRYLLKPVPPADLCKAAEAAVGLRRIARVKRRAYQLLGHVAEKETERAELDARLTRAIDSLHMAYQPIVSWSERRAHAHEALVRTQEPTLRRPDQLFTAAIELGRLQDLSRAIRRSVARLVVRTRHEGCIFVNLHPRDLLDEELYSATAPLSQLARQVVLEITERANLEEVSDLRARLATLRRMGYRLAVDDLGAGYAGLTSFACLEPDVVKLDMSLIRSVDTEVTKQKLVQSMIRLCRELSMQVVAEGVETASERDTLTALGCDLLQGYLFARPGEAFPQVSW
jgi:EAL domain-containing protein (putative c-di-GMP-specific phosphodiesterase class I)/ActR/RegA family two-component response regulator